MTGFVIDCALVTGESNRANWIADFLAVADVAGQSRRVGVDRRNVEPVDAVRLVRFEVARSVVISAIPAARSAVSSVRE